jgi:hypothetical protein
MREIMGDLKTNAYRQPLENEKAKEMNSFLR